MPDQVQSTAAPVDWTDDGIFRSPFLALFEPADRSVLGRAGAILATQAVSGDTADLPVVISHLEAAARDAQFLATFLLEIAGKAVDQLPTEQQERLAAKARIWSQEVQGIAYAIQGALAAELIYGVDEDE